MINTNTLCEVTGLTSASAQALEAFPNPFTDEITLITASQSLENEYVVMDYLGRKMQSGFIHKQRTEISLSGLASGIYILQTNAGQMVKLVKR